MVVDDLDIVRISIHPTKTDAPLSIDADAELVSPVAPQPLQAIAGWRLEILKGS
jgi:hypothetical protein